MNREEKKEKFKELAEILRDTGRLFSESLLIKDNEEKINQIVELEQRADNIQIELDRDFATQKNMPYLSIDRAKLLRRIDNTLDEFKLGSSDILLYSSHLPEDSNEKFTELATNLAEISASLADAIKMIYTNFEDTIPILDRIEKLKDIGLGLTFGIEKYYYNKCDEKGWKQFFAVSTITKQISSCINYIKGTSEILMLMSYKYT